MIFLILFIAGLTFYALMGFKKPVYALGAFILTLIWEAPLIEAYNFPAFLIQLVGAHLLVITLINVLFNAAHYQIYLNRFHFFFLLFIIYFIIRSPETAFSSPIDNRNWVLTYGQLLIFSIFAPIAIRDRGGLITLMNTFILGMTIYGLWFISGVTGGLDTLSEADFGSANSVARYIVVSLVFILYFLYKSKKGIKRTALLSVGIFQFLVLFLTESRTMLALFILILAFVLIRVYQLNVNSVAIIGVSLVISFVFLPEELLDRFIGSLTGESYEGKKGSGQLQSISENIRYALWISGFKMMGESSLFFGIGIGNFRVLILDYLPFLQFGLDSHNTYLSILFEHGIIGMLIYLGILWEAVKAYRIKGGLAGLFRLKNWPKKTFGIWQAFAIVLLIVLVGGLTKHDHYNKLFFLWLSLGFSIQYILAKSQNIKVA